jgi:hypothetical protein
MESDAAHGRIPVALQKAIRARLASLGIKLTIAADALRTETDPVRARELRDRIVALKAEAKALVDRYTWARNLGGADLAAEPEAAEAPEGLLVFGDLDLAGAVAAPGRANDVALPAAFDDVALVLDLGGDEPQARARASAEATSPVLDEIELSLSLAEEIVAAAPQPARGGRLGLALGLAAELAAGRQAEWGGPLAARLLATVAIALERGADEDEAIAAVLFAAVDETNDELVLQQIRGLFGDRVVTLAAWSAWMLRIDPWEQRDRAYVKRLQEAPPSAILVSLCGRVATARAMLARRAASGTGELDRPGRGRERLVWSLRALAKAYRSVGDELLVGPLVDEWERAVAAIDRPGDAAPE